MYHYLPSCKVKQFHSENSLKIQNYLLSKGVEINGCCRISQNQFHEGDIIITNCTSCAIITDEQSPLCQEISLYEYLLEDESFPWPDYQKEQITVQDCYRAVHKPEVQSAIRACLKKMNMIPVEIEENYEKCRFDGTFKYRNISASNLKLAPEYFNKMQQEYIELMDKEHQEKEMENWVKQYTTDRVVVYCNSCLEGVLLGKAKGIHIVDLLAGNL